MRDRDLVTTILAASGAQSVLVWAPGGAGPLGSDWRFEDGIPADIVAAIVRSGLCGYVNSDDERMRDLASADAASCFRYFVKAPDANDNKLVLLGFAGDAGTPSDGAARSMTQLISIAAETSTDVDTAHMSAADVVDLVNGSAHAIGTPLNVISGYAEGILRSSADDSPHRRPLLAIVEQAHRVADTVRRAVEVVRREPRANSHAVSWSELVADTLAMSSSMLKRLGCRARWIGTSNETAVVTVDIPEAIGDLFVILRSLAGRVGPKGLLLIRPSEAGVCAIEVEGRSVDGATVDVVVYTARQSAAASSAT